MEHGFAEEGGAEGDAVESAGEFAVAPGFDAVGELAAVEIGVGFDDGGGDPGRLAVGAALDDPVEAAVEGDLEFALSDDLAEGARHVEVVEVDDGPRVGTEPEDLVAAFIAHGKDAVPVSPQDGVGIELYSAAVAGRVVMFRGHRLGAAPQTSVRRRSVSQPADYPQQQRQDH